MLQPKIIHKNNNLIINKVDHKIVVEQTNQVLLLPRSCNNHNNDNNNNNDNSIHLGEQNYLWYR